MRPQGAWVPGNRWDLAPEAGRAPSVSVVVSHYEQPRELARTLAALRTQTHPGDLLEVVVADDGSSCAPVTAPDVRVVTQPDEGFRVARIRNQAVERTRGEVLLFLDADTVPEPDYVARMARLPGVLPEAVVVGRRRHADLAGLEPGGDVRAVGRAHELSEPAWLVEAYLRTGDLLEADETSFRFVVGAALGCSRWFFEEVGGFDATFTTYGGEDWELVYRAWTHGAVLAHVRDAVAWHDGPARGDRAGWGSEANGRERLVRETVAVASRVPVPGVAPSALLGGGGDPLVTVADDVAGDALLICLDSLLTAWPRARVLLDPARHAVVPRDPRVIEHTGSPDPVLDAAAAGSAWRHLHVLAPCVGDVAAWREGSEHLRGPRAVDRVDVRDGAGEPAATWSTLRARRRAARWEDLPPAAVGVVRAHLQPVSSATTAQAWWGGWA